MKMEYLHEIGMYRIGEYITDGIIVFKITNSHLERVSLSEVPPKVLIFMKLIPRLVYKSETERDIMQKRLVFVKPELLSVGLPTDISTEKYEKFKNTPGEELVSQELLSLIESMNADAIHRLISNYITAYTHVTHGYVVIDPKRKLYDAVLAARNYSKNTKILPVDWWKDLYLKNKAKKWKGGSTFTVHGVLHSCNNDATVWLLTRAESAYMKKVHNTFKKTLKHYNTTLNEIISEAKSKQFHDILQVVKSKNIDPTYNASIFEDIGLPEEFRTLFNYILLAEHNAIAVPALTITKKVFPNPIKYKTIVQKRFDAL